MGSNGGLYQVRMKWQHANAVTAGALWKHRDSVASLQAICNLLHHTQSVAPRLAHDKQGAGSRGERTDQGPAPDLGLGNKAAMADRIDHVDVEPRDVVAHQHQRALRRRFANYF